MADPDFVRSLGPAFLAHRLRRASETIVDGTSGFLGANGFAAPARSVSTLLLLKREGPAGVTGIAQRLRLSHPLIIKLTSALIAAGYAEQRADPRDNRRRLIALTPLGEAEVERLEHLLAVVERTLRALFEEIGVDLSEAIARFEAATDSVPVGKRLEQIAGEGEGA